MNQNDGLEGLLHQYIRNAQAGVFTAMPARVLKADLAEQKVDVQLLQNRLSTDDTSTERPPILSVPLMFQGSKSSQFSFPVSVGDTVLIVFGMRDIDRFKAGSSQAHDPRTNRKYNRQDAIAIPGLFSFSQARNNPSKHSLDHSTDDAVMVSNLGSGAENEVRLRASGAIEVNMAADSSMSVSVSGSKVLDLSSSEANFNVPVTAPDFTTDNGVSLNNHTHAQGSDSDGDGEQETNPPTVTP